MAVGSNLRKSDKEDLATKIKENIPLTGVESKEPVRPSSKKRILNKNTEAEIKRLKNELKSEETAEEETRLLVVFPVGKEEYAMEIDHIKEVVPAPEVSPIPQSENYIRGVANVRGNVLAIIDLAVKFGLKGQSKNSDETNYVIVINSEEIKVAVASSQVPETLIIKERKIDGADNIMRKSAGDQAYIKGVIKHDGRMIILLDVLEMVTN